jgi:hypothetical protein
MTLVPADRSSMLLCSLDRALCRLELPPSALAHHPEEPGPPLNGPTIRDVTQPP